MLRGAIAAMLLTAAVYTTMLLYFDAGSLAEHCTKLTMAQIGGLLGVSSLNFVFRFIRWGYYLRRLKLVVPFSESVLIFLAGFAMSLSPGKLGEVLKSVMLRASIDAAMSRTSPIVIAERVTDVAGLVLLGAYGLGVSTGAWWFAGLLIAGVAFLGAIVGSRSLGHKVAMLVSAPQRVRRFREKLLDMLDALRDMVTWKAYLYGSFLSVIAWGAHGATLMLAANIFPDVDVSFAESQVVYSGPLIAGTLAMLPGGVGLTEASMAGAIMKTGGAGATAPVAAAITIVVRGVTFWFAIAIGVLALGAWQWRQRQLTAARQSTET